MSFFNVQKFSLFFSAPRFWLLPPLPASPPPPPPPPASFALLVTALRCERGSACITCSFIISYDVDLQDQQNVKYT